MCIMFVSRRAWGGIPDLLSMARSINHASEAAGAAGGRAERQ